ncbi:hypothetical protein K4K55_000059 [Colletotrichum sp. SAR 10_96]|nr:hypothetical protein K4K55_000059 [Colletotrichum sp. SAR 10_96]
MKYSFALAALAALVVAQDASIIPECARDCLSKATASATSCKEGDYACTCKPDNKAAIQSAATSCVIAACGVDVAVSEVIPASEKLCAAAGSGSASSAVSSAASAASSAASEASSAAPSLSIPTSASGSVSLPYNTVTGTEPAATTTVAATTTKAGGSNATTTGAGSASTTPVQAGAGALAPIGGLAMLVLGALAI